MAKAPANTVAKPATAPAPATTDAPADAPADAPDDAPVAKVKLMRHKTSRRVCAYDPRLFPSSTFELYDPEAEAKAAEAAAKEKTKKG